MGFEVLVALMKWWSKFYPSISTSQLELDTLTWPLKFLFPVYLVIQRSKGILLHGRIFYGVDHIITKSSYSTNQEEFWGDHPHDLMGPHH
jgi:hypothetical protein